MKIAIVGASGQLGRKILDAVLARGTDAGSLIAAVRSPEKLAEYASKGVNVRRADYEQLETLTSALEGVQRVLLIPTLAPPAQRVGQLENAISAARTSGVEHLVTFSLVPAVIESPFVVTPFLLYSESALRLSGLDWTIIRNGLYADPIGEWVDDIVKMGTIPYPTGNGRCAFVSRDDIARATAAVLTTDGHASATYDFTGPEALTTTDLCSAVARVTGQPVEDRGATDEDYIKVCLEGGEPEMFARLLLTMYHAIRDGFFDIVSDDIEKITGKKSERFEAYLRRQRA